MPSDWRRLAVPAVVGAVLRTAWVAGRAVDPYDHRNPGVRNLRAAVELSGGSLPQSNGAPSAFVSLGYPALLAPVSRALAHVPITDLSMAAAALNVIVGTAAILLAGRLAGRAFGDGAGPTTAWLVALLPGLVVLTSVATSTTLLVTLVLATLLAAAAVDATASTRHLVALGALAAAATWVSPTGLLLVPVVVATTRRRAGGRRPTLLVGAVVAVALLPLVLLTGVTTGVWVPAPTEVALDLCTAHREGATASAVAVPQERPACLRSRAFRAGTVWPPAEADLDAGSPSEAAWAQDVTAEAVVWAVTHPADEARLALARTGGSLTTVVGPLDLVDDLTTVGRPPEQRGQWDGALIRAAVAWQVVVVALAGLALVLTPAARGARLLWSSALVLLVPAWLGGVDGKAHLPALVLVAVLAGAWVASVRDPSATGSDDRGDVRVDGAGG